MKSPSIMLIAGEASGDTLAAELVVALRRELLARPIATADAVIAATALAHGTPLATRNVADFAEIGLELINPWDVR